MLRTNLVFTSSMSAARTFSVTMLLLAMLPANSARAADWYTGAVPAKPADNWIVAVDASTTVTSTGSSFAAASSTIATDGLLSASGTRVRIEGLAGTYTLSSSGSALQTKGEQAQGAVLVGYEWAAPKSSFSAFGGLEVRGSHFSDTDPNHAANGTQFGFKAALEYFATPSDRTMLSGYASYSTNYDAYYTRWKWGMTPFAQIYVGPEVSFLGDDFFREWRLGAHLTGVKFGAIQFGISGGYVLDKSGRGGGYGTLDVHATY